MEINVLICSGNGSRTYDGYWNSVQTIILNEVDNNVLSELIEATDTEKELEMLFRGKTKEIIFLGETFSKIQASPMV